MAKVFRDTVSGFTHMGGAVLAIVGTVFLGIRAAQHGGMAILTSLIFGISMVLMFSFSCTYHLVRGPKKAVAAFKIVDHCMIYVLIAGTYTPAVYLVFGGWLRWTYLIGIWACALSGIAFKLFFTGKFRTISTVLYCVMGLLIVFATVPFYQAAGFWATFFLVLGGVLYIAGAIVYAFEKPGVKRAFGKHEVFHILVILGAAAHYVMVLCFIL